MAPVHALPQSGGEDGLIKDDREKTIPFLKQLTDMLQNNEELISFVPGQTSPNRIILGRIIVHDRSRVQSEVLPVYFNHASFASLRRQLSYFSFVRVGKSRQSGVTYTNDAVVELSDILSLRRRASGAASNSKQQAANEHKPTSPPLKLQEQQRTTTFADDVASAVISGTLHAANSNRSLDIKNACASNGVVEEVLFNPAVRAARSINGTAQSSLSQSTASSSSSEAVSNSGKGNGNGKIASKSTQAKQVHKRKGPSLMAKHSIPRKDRARLDRLLSLNNIVPFIHLPAGLTVAPSQKKERSSVESTLTARGSINEHVKEQRGSVHQKENKLQAVRERVTSDCAVNALLALGTDRQ